MGVLIDSSVFIAAERGLLVAVAGGGSGLDEVLAQPSFLAAISLSELLHGVHRANSAVRRERRARFVEGLAERLPVLAFDAAVARVHATVWADMVGAGRMIGAHDLQIAATAIAHGLRVLTLDERDFRAVPGLEVVTPG